MTGSFVARLMRSQGHLVHKLSATDTTGQPAWYLVHVRPEKEKAFLASIDGPGTIDLEDYGVVVASGYGRRPDAAAKARIKAELGFDVEW